MVLAHSTEREQGAQTPYTTIAVQEADLVNRRYHDGLVHAVLQRSQPTVHDAIQAQLAQGNAPYYDHDWHGDGKALPFTPAERKDWLPNEYFPSHDISHLCGRFGHVMQNEMFLLPFEYGLTSGMGVRRFSDQEVTTRFNALKEYNLTLYQAQTKQYQSWPAEAACKRDWAVYFGAGMYLREKIEAFKRAGLLDKPYAQQAAFCDAYAATDHPPQDTDRLLYTGQEILEAPYPLILLSQKEWRAIAAVALGLRVPEETAYPQRLGAVNEALQHVGLAYDMKPELARAVMNHASNRARAGLSPEEFDAQRFHEARQRRGVER